MINTMLAKEERKTMSRRPNVILFLADDLGYGDIGVHGNSVVKTPHIDAFAKESIEWDRFYVSPVCAPTRASMMTGRYNFRTGVTDVFGRGCEMATDEVTVAELLQDAGYATGLFGKWHLGDQAQHSPTQRGFGEVLSFTGCAMRADEYFDPTLLHNDVPEARKGYCLDIFTDAAIAFMNSHRNDPFFIFLPSNLIHTPLVAPDSLVAQYDNLGLIESTQKTYAMVQNLDDNFGKLRKALNDLGLEDDTLLIATSDNGPCSGSNPVERHMAGLHGLKGTVYENGIRVPCFMRWPNGFSAASVRTQIAAHVDLLPTIADACGVSLPPGRTLDGTNLMPILRQPDSSRTGRDLMFQWDSGETPRRGHAFCVLNQRWKLVQPCGMDSCGQQHIRDRYAELCQLQDRGDRSIDGPARFELYDLQADPGEHVDLAGKHPEIVNEMRMAYDAWFDEVTDRYPQIPRQRS